MNTRNVRLEQQQQVQQQQLAAAPAQSHACHLIECIYRYFRFPLHVIPLLLRGLAREA
jgi:hypothetical protein